MITSNRQSNAESVTSSGNARKSSTANADTVVKQHLTTEAASPLVNSNNPAYIHHLFLNHAKQAQTSFTTHIPSPFIQPQLKIGAIDSPQEKQADEVAQQVTATNPSQQIESAINDSAVALKPRLTPYRSPSHKYSASSESGRSRQALLQPKRHHDGGAPVTKQAAQAIGSPGAGKPLSESIRTRIEPVVNADLSHARVHDNPQARQAANSINAKAFTTDNHIFLGAGQSANDLQLMAHEATHVVQQTLGALSVGEANVFRDPLEQLIENDESEWQASGDHLALLNLGGQWALLPGGFILTHQPSTLEAAQGVNGRLADQGTIMGVPSTGASGSRFIRIGTRRAIQLDAGRGARVTAAIYMDQVHGLMGRMGLSEISQLKIIHIHRDHVSEIARIAVEFNLSPGSIAIPQEFVTGTIRRDLQRAIRELRNQGGDWTGWVPGQISKNRSGTNEFTLTRSTHGDVTIEYLSLPGAMQHLSSGSRVTAKQVDTASFITRVTRRSDGARVITLGDVRFNDLELFRNAMGATRFNDFFRGVTTINGFSHHAGRMETGDIRGLMAMLDATLYKNGQLNVVVQTDLTQHSQTRQDTIELMRRLGINVTISERAQAVGEGSSGVTATRDSVTAYGSRATQLTTIQSPLTGAIQRLQTLHESKSTLRAWRSVFSGRGVDVDRTISEIDTSMETLRGSIRQASEAAARVRTSGGTTAAGARDYTAGTQGAAYQRALAAIPATTPAETMIGPAGFETLRQYRRRNINQAPRQVALEAALRNGTYSDTAFSYMLSQMDPTIRDSVLYGKRGGPRPRDVAFRRLRAQYIFQQNILPNGHTVSLAGMSRGRRIGARGVGGLLAGIELANIGMEGYQSYQMAHNTSRRRHVAPFLRRIAWWNQMGVMPRLGAVDEGIFSNDYFSNPATVIEGLKEDRWDGLWIAHSDNDPALPDAQVLRLGVFLAQNIRNYDEFAAYFIDGGQDAITWVGDGSFSERRWLVKAGGYDTDWENETTERWVEVPLLTQLMQTYVRHMITNTETLLDMQGRGEAPTAEQPDPKLGGLTVAIQTRFGNKPWKAEFKTPQSSTTVYVATQGRNIGLLAREVEWWSSNPSFYVYGEQGGRYQVGGADYNTYAALRRLTTQKTQLNIGQRGMWEETTSVALESGMVEIDKSLLEPVPELGDFPIPSGQTQMG
ncbi:DUF4157 domain-containing protein [Aliikangiella maris]|uniref:DUF4157 domain-containing protein n=2 Tax=Aliikangiella maris TaxID=3162458 RepID=A0ABV3MJP6_9GAMM